MALVVLRKSGHPGGARGALNDCIDGLIRHAPAGAAIHERNELSSPIQASRPQRPRQNLEDSSARAQRWEYMLQLARESASASR
jgi:hypothetical protein